MQFFIHFIAIVLTGYLSFTNFLANEISRFIPFETTTETTEIPLDATSSDALTTLSSLTDTIPNILLQSPAYQQAALIGSTDTIIATTADPLEALVNIYCTFTTDTYIRTTTGTGFFVSPDGVILTNAHVAQFFLLENADVSGKTECVIRTGNPAAPRYTAELLYIPPSWVQSHASLIDDSNPTGTGERDYALLYVNATMSGGSLPASFPALKTDTELLPRSVTGSSVIAAGYPADSLLHNGDLNTNLLPKEATSTITELYTFGSNYADVFSITGTAIGEHGSSGGPIIASNGNVIGMITTRGDDAADGVGSLRAITLSHINRTITEETGFSFARNVSGDLPYRAKIFTNTLAPFLTNLLAIEVNKNN